MTKRKETEAAAIEPTINPPVEGPEPDGHDEALAWAQALAEEKRARGDLLREVLTHTHATARLPADLLRRIEEAVS